MSKDEALESLETGDGEPSKNETYEFPDVGAMPESEVVLIHSLSPFVVNISLDLAGPPPWGFPVGTFQITGCNLDRIYFAAGDEIGGDINSALSFTPGDGENSPTVRTVAVSLTSTEPGDYDLILFDSATGRPFTWTRRGYFIVRAGERGLIDP